MVQPIDNVLVVDDDEISMYFTKKLLQSRNIASNIDSAEHGLEALKKLRTYALNKEKLPEVIFLDLNMPVLDGFEFLNSLSSESFDLTSTKIVVLTSSSNQNDIDLAHSLNVAGYLTKPLTEQKIKAVI